MPRKAGKQRRTASGASKASASADKVDDDALAARDIDQFASDDDDHGAENSGDESTDGEDGAKHGRPERVVEISDDEEDADRKKKKKGKKKAKAGSFQAMGLSQPVLQGVLRKGYKLPTPIQRRTIPVIMAGHDVAAMARTGSGKTAAFLVPMLERLKMHSAKIGARALIISPTRELATQTFKFCKELARFTDLRMVLILGGDDMSSQFSDMHANPDIIVAVPGRLLHLIVEMDLQLSSIEYLVMDEADRIFEMGQDNELHEITARLPESRQTLLFSATLPKMLVEFARAGLRNPTLIRLDADTKVSENLRTQYFFVRRDDKPAIMLNLVRRLINENKQCVLFTATKHHVEYLKDLIQAAGLPCTYCYGSLDPTARKINVAKFRNGRVPLLLVTDVAARGIDIPLLDYVVNYDFPCKPKLFVHRVGRVARAGRSGTAYSLVSADEIPFVLDLHLFLGRPFRIAKDVPSANSSQDGVFGSVPQALTDDERDGVVALHANKHDLDGALKTALNAYKLYDRSRTLAAKQSVARAKELERAGFGIHPMFAAEVEDNEVQRMDMLKAISGYRPRATVFEINKKAGSAAMEIMEVKRTQHQHMIDDYAEKAPHRLQRVMQGQPAAQPDAPLASSGDRKVDRDSAEEATREVDLSEVESAFSSIIAPGHKKPVATQESDFYIPYQPADHNTEQALAVGSNFTKDADKAMLSLGGDDDQSLKSGKAKMKWDRRKKKYVGESNSVRMITTEHGTKIPASYKSQRYQEWAKKKHLSRPHVGDEEDADNERHWEETKVRSKMRRFKHHSGGDGVEPSAKRRKGSKAASSGGELRSSAEILKMRRQKDQQKKRLQDSLKRKQMKGKKKGGRK